MKIILVSVTGPTVVSDGEIMTSTFAVEADDAQPGDNPVMVTFSVNPTQHDPEDAVEALRSVADLLDEAIDRDGV